MSRPSGPSTDDDQEPAPERTRRADGPDAETRALRTFALPIIPAPRPGGVGRARAGDGPRPAAAAPLPSPAPLPHPAPLPRPAPVPPAPATPPAPAVMRPAVPPPARAPTPPGPAPMGSAPTPASPPSPVDPDATPPVASGGGRLRHAWQQPRVRRPVLGLAVVGQAFVIISAIGWWTASHTAASATETPVTWDAVVENVGPAGVNLRATPAVMPGSARGTAGPSTHLHIVCGVTGDAVSRGAVRTATWLKTDDDRYVSGLYVHMVGKTQIASCPQQDLPLISVPDQDTDDGTAVDPSTSVPARTVGSGQTTARTTAPSTDPTTDAASDHGDDQDAGRGSDTVGRSDGTAHGPDERPVGTGTATPTTQAPTSTTSTTPSGLLGRAVRTAHDKMRPRVHHDPINAGTSTPAG